MHFRLKEVILKQRSVVLPCCDCIHVKRSQYSNVPSLYTEKIRLGRHIMSKILTDLLIIDDEY